MNIYDLISRVQKLRKETQPDSVSPDRVGGLLEDTLKYIAEIGAVPADAELSATSTNSPQNKVVTKKFAELESEVAEIKNLVESGEGGSGEGGSGEGGSGEGGSGEGGSGAADPNNAKMFALYAPLEVNGEFITLESARTLYDEDYGFEIPQEFKSWWSNYITGLIDENIATMAQIEESFNKGEKVLILLKDSYEFIGLLIVLYLLALQEGGDDAGIATEEFIELLNGAALIPYYIYPRSYNFSPPIEGEPFGVVVVGNTFEASIYASGDWTEIIEGESGDGESGDGESGNDEVTEVLTIYAISMMWDLSPSMLGIPEEPTEDDMELLEPILAIFANNASVYNKIMTSDTPAKSYPVVIDYLLDSINGEGWCRTIIPAVLVKSLEGFRIIPADEYKSYIELIELPDFGYTISEDGGYSRKSSMIMFATVDTGELHESIVQQNARVAKLLLYNQVNISNVNIFLGTSSLFNTYAGEEGGIPGMSVVYMLMKVYLVYNEARGNIMAYKLDSGDGLGDGTNEIHFSLPGGISKFDPYSSSPKFTAVVEFM